MLALKTLFASARNGGKKAVEKLAQSTKDKAFDLTEEAILAAVDQALNVVEIAGQRVREREIPTQNVQLEVSVNIAGLAELKMKVSVPETADLEKKIIVDANYSEALKTAPEHHEEDLQ
ncbi:hypothetical protein GS601_12710 [Myxacorys almedinensis A]|uniref:Uncharacterized protein n=2 Tax=Myxacorys TaxID=2056239 RepID=A0A8J8CLV4_9CYAN|nr:hypothetical protein [Myxacorys almedinensis A]